MVTLQMRTMTVVSQTERNARVLALQIPSIIHITVPRLAWPVGRHGEVTNMFSVGRGRVRLAGVTVSLGSGNMAVPAINSYNLCPCWNVTLYC